MIAQIGGGAALGVAELAHGALIRDVQVQEMLRHKAFPGQIIKKIINFRVSSCSCITNRRIFATENCITTYLGTVPTGGRYRRYRKQP